MDDIQSASTPPLMALDEAVENGVQDSLLSAVKWLTRYYDKYVSTAVLYSDLPRDRTLSAELAVKMLDQTGITSGWVKRELKSFSDYLFPIVLSKNDGTYCIVTTRQKEKGQEVYTVILPETGVQRTVNAADLAKDFTGYALLASRKPEMKSGIDNILPEVNREGHWLFSTLWRYRHFFYSAAMAALLANILTLATTFFTMNVYDRVVPNQAYATLWSLAIGVIIAIIFEFTSRQIRAWLIDVAGKKADLILGSTLFRQMMSVRLEHKPQSAGSFANQLREFESVRDFMTSATLATLSDIPFCILFLLIIYLIGGPLAAVPLLAVPVILIASILIQRPLSRYMNENMRESSLKHGLLIESIEGIEALKAARGEGVMQKRWEDFSALSASTSMKIRHLSSLTMGFTTFVQQVVTVIIVVWGVYLIHSGNLTMGSMIGVVILSGRCLSPLAAMVGLAIRYQQAKTALQSLNQFMDMPTDRDAARSYLPSPRFEGSIRLRKVNFEYPIPGMPNTLKVIDNVSFQIGRGERVAIIGNIGSGKSTLLKLVARLYQPKSGQMSIDGVDVAQIDPADWRTAVGYVGQDCRLFFGSLRENVMIGNPSATTAHFLRVAKMTGLDQIAAQHPMGFDMPVGEMGQLLSGGQRQLVALARCLLLEPKIILMDEPTSSMDALTEAKFIDQLQKAITDQTLIIVTHRFSLLQLVSRLMVLVEGRVTHDGEKDAVIAELNSAHNVEKK
ncbi:type I secretion system permease/ATPase [Enterobacteriaceae bacterium YMB-R22]|jgi:ATP-binding cassette subfamily C protein LapB|uniref:type I secretion system permease/ATPase n=1 Tax=Tenebrionicola larvae TaxID=2815733 RepID=UPI002012E01A|nr:type I secretion system permease/ATPase [Tenebrionicola larvae]MBV4414546.1 type I secretion system permease/ATPase [Tenebrionicola larvae]